MRIKSHWFKPGAEKGATEIAGAAGFIVFRIAQNALKHMRGACYELPPGAPYFAFLAEFLAFLTLCADRIAHARGDEAGRVEFTTAMANKVGGYLADNQADLLGGDSPEGYKKRFIALVNERSVDYAGFRWTDEGPEYGLVRCFGDLVQVRCQFRRAIHTLACEAGQHADLRQARPQFIVYVVRNPDAFLFQRMLFIQARQSPTQATNGRDPERARKASRYDHRYQ